MLVSSICSLKQVNSNSLTNIDHCLSVIFYFICSHWNHKSLVTHYVCTFTVGRYLNNWLRVQQVYINPRLRIQSVCLIELSGSPASQLY